MIVLIVLSFNTDKRSCDVALEISVILLYANFYLLDSVKNSLKKFKQVLCEFHCVLSN